MRFRSLLALASAAASSHDDLSWRGVSVSIGRRTVLHPTSGRARAGRLLGVLGPSGAGKSTALAAMVDGSPAARRKRLSGSLASSSPRLSEGTVALLAQDDSFFGLLTVRETLQLAAALQPAADADADAACVDSLLRTLGLWDVRDTRVGDRTHRGVSGGERRRLAVGCELVGEPRALIADEPTTGLDAHQAGRVVALIKGLAAERGIPAVATLHQPRSSIWHGLDDVLLMAPGGRVAYHGPADDALRHFARLGHRCPPLTNPAEFLIDLVSIDHDSADGAARDEARVAALTAAFDAASAASAARTGGATAGAPRAGGDAPVGDGTPQTPQTRQTAQTPPRRRLHPLRRFGLLLRRAWRQNARDGWANGLRLAVSGGLALVFGEIYGSFSTPSAATVAERVAVLSFGAINMAMMSLMKTLDLLGRERAVVHRERSRRQYGGAEYLLAKLVAELPLDAAYAGAFGLALKWRCGLRAPAPALVGTLALSAACCAALGLAVGALVPGQDAALAVGLPVMLVHMVLGVINPAGAAAAKPPSPLTRAVGHASPIKWAVQGLCCAELRGLELERSTLSDAPRMGGLALVTSGDQVLERLGLREQSCGRCLANLAAVLGIEVAVAFVGLALTRPRFQRMDPPSVGVAPPAAV